MKKAKEKKKRMLRAVIVRYLFVAGFFFLAVHFNWISNTLSVMSDREKSENNHFEVGILNPPANDVTAESTDGALLKMAAASPDSGSLFHRKIEIKRGEDSKGNKNLPFWYIVKADNFSGDLCDKLVIETELNGTTIDIEDGKDLKKFSYPVLEPADPDTWNFEINLKDGADASGEDKCDFDLVFSSWQINPDYVPEGFSDKKTFSNSVTTKKQEKVETPKDNVIDQSAANDTGTEAVGADGAGGSAPNSIPDETKEDIPAPIIDETEPETPASVPDFPPTQ